MQDLVEKLAHLLEKRGWILATAESCTGGLLSAALTHRPGSSNIFERGFITYSNQSKEELLDVPAAIFITEGAVSASCAESMAQGALKNSRADIAASITGIAGPDGGSKEKPVGLVFIGYALKDGSRGSVEYQFSGTRQEIRAKSTAAAMEKLVQLLEDN